MPLAAAPLTPAATGGGVGFYTAKHPQHLCLMASLYADPADPDPGLAVADHHAAATAYPATAAFHAQPWAHPGIPMPGLPSVQIPPPLPVPRIPPTTPQRVAGAAVSRHPHPGLPSVQIPPPLPIPRIPFPRIPTSPSGCGQRQRQTHRRLTAHDLRHWICWLRPAGLSTPEGCPRQAPLTCRPWTRWLRVRSDLATRDYAVDDDSTGSPHDAWDGLAQNDRCSG